jgi:hypothetical protein
LNYIWKFVCFTGKWITVSMILVKSVPTLTLPCTSISITSTLCIFHAGLYHAELAN